MSLERMSPKAFGGLQSATSPLGGTQSFTKELRAALLLSKQTALEYLKLCFCTARVVVSLTALFLSGS